MGLNITVKAASTVLASGEIPIFVLIGPLFYGMTRK